MSKQIKVTPE
ncbi:Protein of unknown function [Bacillus cereus]|nr:Protein of unknown function [Bacillus cereus]SCN36938.1 Protein of unknown function [Bacillus wiedmannii]